MLVKVKESVILLYRVFQGLRLQLKIIQVCYTNYGPKLFHYKPTWPSILNKIMKVKTLCISQTKMKRNQTQVELITV